MIHVPFRDQNQAFVSIANGELTWMFSTLASATPMVKAGRIKLLAIVGKNRLPTQPEIPTLAQAGGPAELEVVAWIALFARQGTPREVVQKINADVNKQLTTPDVVERMRNSGWEAAPSTPGDVAAVIRADTKKYAELVRRTGASAD
jgi:tripartite-type tricarboxylate transporter receptor subunit TctC